MDQGNVQRTAGAWRPAVQWPELMTLAQSHQWHKREEMGDAASRSQGEGVPTSVGNTDSPTTSFRPRLQVRMPCMSEERMQPCHPHQVAEEPLHHWWVALQPRRLWPREQETLP